LEPVAPADALDALLQQAYWLTLRDRRRNRRMVEQYMALANAVPAFRLSYPSNVGRVEAILLRLSAHVRDELLRRDSS
jgi:hypothetical protein